MKQVEFLWDTGSDMIVLARNVNAVLEELESKRFKILEIKPFGKSVVSVKNGAITYDIYDEDTTGRKILQYEDTSDVEGLIVCIVYDDNR